MRRRPCRHRGGAPPRAHRSGRPPRPGAKPGRWTGPWRAACAIPGHRPTSPEAPRRVRRGPSLAVRAACRPADGGGRLRRRPPGGADRARYSRPWSAARGGRAAGRRGGRIPGSREARRPGFRVAASRPKAKGRAGLTATCRERMAGPHNFSSAAFIMSRSPTLTPPLVTIASHRDAASWRKAARVAPSSPAMPRSTVPKPSAPSWASSAGRLASRTFPGARRPLLMTSSSPVESTPTVGRGWTSRLWTPRLESTPMWAGPRYVPGPNTSSPAATSSPALRTFVPGLTGSSTMTNDPSPSTRTRSTMQTVSAPGGSPAPVMIRTDSPSDTKALGSSPAMTHPTTRSRAGAATVSAARSA